MGQVISTECLSHIIIPRPTSFLFMICIFFSLIGGRFDHVLQKMKLSRRTSTLHKKSRMMLVWKNVRAARAGSGDVCLLFIYNVPNEGEHKA